MQAKILLAEDEPKYVRILELLLGDEDFRLHAVRDGESAIRELDRSSFDAVVADLQMPGVGGMAVLERVREMDPDLPVLVVTAYGTVRSAVEAMRIGAFDYVEKPFDGETLKLQLQRAVEIRRLKLHNHELRRSLAEASGFHRIMGNSKLIRRAVDLARRVARTEATVLLLGESGTGKELFARAIHEGSPRSTGPFVKVNCAAIPANLLEAELFGVEKGAYTGADRPRPGRFERARGGTLFLDEIGELDPALQPKLLQAIEERVVGRLGGGEPAEIDVRFVAATNRDLEEAVRNGEFRTDLYHRLAVFPITVPPLRERGDDVVELANFLVERFNEAMGRKMTGVSPRAGERLREFAWPGNVRQLANVIERGMILCSGEVLEPEHLTFSGESRSTAGGDGFRLPEEGVSLDQLERNFLEQALQKADGNKARAAKLLGLSRNTLRYRLDKHGIEG